MDGSSEDAQEQAKRPRGGLDAWVTRPGSDILGEWKKKDLTPLSSMPRKAG
jgi:hypothetical protein